MDDLLSKAQLNGNSADRRCRTTLVLASVDCCRRDQWLACRGESETVEGGVLAGVGYGLVADDRDHLKRDRESRSAR